jgi:xylulokinase
VLFLPHLMGERALEFDPGARGVFAGLTLAHRRPHLLRAILEGNAYQLRRLLDRFGPERIGDVVISGGGANSPLWREILATVLHRRLLLPRVTESGLLGAAMLAAVHVGQFENLSAASDAWVEFVDTQEPIVGWQEVYEEGYRRFCGLHG